VKTNVNDCKGYDFEVEHLEEHQYLEENETKYQRIIKHNTSLCINEFCHKTVYTKAYLLKLSIRIEAFV